MQPEHPEKSGITRKRSSVPLYMCTAVILFGPGCLQDVFPFFHFLKFIKPSLSSIILAVLSVALAKRFSISALLQTTEGRIFVGLWILGLIGIPFAVWPSGSLRAWKLYYGLTLVIFICIIGVIDSAREVRVLLWSIVACGFCMAIGVLFFPVIVYGIHGARYSITHTYDPNDVGLIFVTLIPLAYGLQVNEKRWMKVMLTVGILLMCAGTIKTGSRGALIGLGVESVMFLLMKIGNLSFVKKLLLLGASAFVIVMVTPSDTLFSRFSDLISGEDYNFKTGDQQEEPGRIELWTKSLQLLSAYPVFGVGVYQLPNALGSRFGSFYYVTAHNSFLQILIELGPLGLILFIGMLRQIGKNALFVSRISYTVGSASLRNSAHCTTMALWGYIVCACFLSMAYSIFLVLLLLYSFGLKKTAVQELDAAGNSLDGIPDGIESSRAYATAIPTPETR